jgi:CheY-specific phosphatase CheX
MKGRAVPVVNAEIVNALLEPVSAVLRAWTGDDRPRSKLELATELPPPPGISVSIGVQGELVGRITWNFELPVARQIAATMLARTGVPVEAEACVDAVAELANVIAGNAVGVLAAAGYTVDILPPETAVRSDAAPLPERTLSVGYETPAGKLTMYISVDLAPAQAGKVSSADG